MSLTVLSSQATEIPPDVAAVLGGTPIHPELLHRAPLRPALPTAATLTEAALTFAAYASADAEAPSHAVLHRRLIGEPEWEGRPLGVKGIVHVVGQGGVLHLKETGTLRAVSLVRGALAQRCTKRPTLRPGVVRLVPAGRAVTLADLAGDGAVAVEVSF